MKKENFKLTIREITLFGMLGALMWASKIAMEALPNIHLIGVFIVAETVVYRWKALFPIYIFAIIEGVWSGFNLWWLPYLYIWTVLWIFVMLIPKKLPNKARPFVYAGVCALHGFLYGTLYAPFMAIAYYNFDIGKTLASIVSGIPYDALHGLGNLVLGLILITPLIKLLRLARDGKIT